MARHTYDIGFAAWLGTEIVTIPDALAYAPAQREWDSAGNKSFIAYRAGGVRVRVRLAPEEYDLYGGGGGDCIVRR